MQHEANGRFMSALIIEIERELLLGGCPFLLGLEDEQRTQTLGMQFVNADNGLREAIGELATSDEILRLLHHHAHLLQMIRRDAAEATGVDDEPSRLRADARHTQDVLVGS